MNDTENNGPDNCRDGKPKQNSFEYAGEAIDPSHEGGEIERLAKTRTAIEETLLAHLFKGVIAPNPLIIELIKRQPALDKITLLHRNLQRRHENEKTVPEALTALEGCSVALASAESLLFRLLYPPSEMNVSDILAVTDLMERALSLLNSAVKLNDDLASVASQLTVSGNTEFSLRVTQPPPPGADLQCVPRNWSRRRRDAAFRATYEFDTARAQHREAIIRSACSLCANHIIAAVKDHKETSIQKIKLSCDLHLG